MPGIVGFSGLNTEADKKISVLKEMQKIIMHSERCKADELYCENDFCCSRVYLNAINKRAQPFVNEGIFAWVDGEFNNKEELSKKTTLKSESEPEILLEYFLQNKGFNFLGDINGIYSAVIYDSRKQEVHLISDRLGMRYLYWTVNNGCLVWGSEVKAFFKIPGFNLNIDKQAVQEFLEVGHLLGNRTFLEAVSLIPSGTVLTWDIKNKKLSTNQYWWWDKIKPVNYKISQEEASEELTSLFKKAVQRRVGKDEKIGIMLSGGLDSRAIMAEFPDCSNPLHVLTFGEKTCDDIRYAVQAAKVKGAIHHVVEMNKDNWFFPLLKGIWQIDGQFSMAHMHSLDACDQLANVSDINMDGIGSYMIKGSLLKDKRFFDRPINKELASSVMGGSTEILTTIDNYDDLNKTDYYITSNRIRRFTNAGLMLGSNYLQHRAPFLDNHLIEFSYILPDSLKYGKYLFYRMLLNAYPKYYNDILTTSSAIPISYSKNVIAAYSVQRKVYNKSIRIISKKLNKYPSLGILANYAEWIRQNPIKPFVEKVLFNPNALYKEFISVDQVQKHWEMHLKGVNQKEKICIYLTFEIWLQQVFNGRYMNWEEE